MAEYCVELLGDPALRTEMGERGRARSLKEFDLKVMIAQIEKLYDELLISKGFQK